MAGETSYPSASLAAKKGVYSSQSISPTGRMSEAEALQYSSELEADIEKRRLEAEADVEKEIPRERVIKADIPPPQLATYYKAPSLETLPDKPNTKQMVAEQFFSMAAPSGSSIGVSPIMSNMGLYAQKLEEVRVKNINKIRQAKYEAETSPEYQAAWQRYNELVWEQEMIHNEELELAAREKERKFDAGVAALNKLWKEGITPEALTNNTGLTITDLASGGFVQFAPSDVKEPEVAVVKAPELKTYDESTYQQIIAERPQYAQQYTKEELGTAVRTPTGWDIRTAGQLKADRVMAADVAVSPYLQMRTAATKANIERNLAVNTVASDILQYGYSTDVSRRKYLESESKENYYMGLLGEVPLTHGWYEPTKQAREYSVGRYSPTGLTSDSTKTPSLDRDITKERPLYVSQFTPEELATALPTETGWDIRTAGKLKADRVMAEDVAASPYLQLRTDATKANIERNLAVDLSIADIAKYGYSTDETRRLYLLSEAKENYLMGLRGGVPLTHGWYEPTEQAREYGVGRYSPTATSVAMVKLPTTGRDITKERPRYVSQFTPEQLATATPTETGWDIKEAGRLQAQACMDAARSTDTHLQNLYMANIALGKRQEAIGVIKGDIATLGYSTDESRRQYLGTEAEHNYFMGVLGGLPLTHRWYEPTEQAVEYGVGRYTPETGVQVTIPTTETSGKTTTIGNTKFNLTILAYEKPTPETPPEGTVNIGGTTYHVSILPYQKEPTNIDYGSLDETLFGLTSEQKVEYVNTMVTSLNEDITEITPDLESLNTRGEEYEDRLVSFEERWKPLIQDNMFVGSEYQYAVFQHEYQGLETEYTSIESGYAALEPQLKDIRRQEGEVAYASMYQTPTFGQMIEGQPLPAKLTYSVSHPLQWLEHSDKVWRDVLYVAGVRPVEYTDNENIVSETTKSMYNWAISHPTSTTGLALLVVGAPEVLGPVALAHPTAFGVATKAMDIAYVTTAGYSLYKSRGLPAAERRNLLGEIGVSTLLFYGPRAYRFIPKVSTQVGTRIKGYENYPSVESQTIRGFVSEPEAFSVTGVSYPREPARKPWDIPDLIERPPTVKVMGETDAFGIVSKAYPPTVRVPPNEIPDLVGPPPASDVIPESAILDIGATAYNRGVKGPADLIPDIVGAPKPEPVIPESAAYLDIGPSAYNKGVKGPADLIPDIVGAPKPEPVIPESAAYLDIGPSAYNKGVKGPADLIPDLVGAPKPEYVIPEGVAEVEGALAYQKPAKGPSSLIADLVGDLKPSEYRAWSQKTPKTTTRGSDYYSYIPDTRKPVKGYYGRMKALDELRAGIRTRELIEPVKPEKIARGYYGRMNALEEIRAGIRTDELIELSRPAKVARGSRGRLNALEEIRLGIRSGELIELPKGENIARGSYGRLNALEQIRAGTRSGELIELPKGEKIARGSRGRLNALDEILRGIRSGELIELPQPEKVARGYYGRARALEEYATGIRIRDIEPNQYDNLITLKEMGEPTTPSELDELISRYPKRDSSGGVYWDGYYTDKILQLPSPKWDTSLLPVPVEGTAKTYKVSSSTRPFQNVKEIDIIGVVPERETILGTTISRYKPFRNIDVTNEIPREVGFGGGVYETEQVLQLPSPKWDSSLLPVPVEGTARTYAVSSGKSGIKSLDVTGLVPEREIIIDTALETDAYLPTPKETPKWFLTSQRLNKPFKTSIPKPKPVEGIELEGGRQILIQKMDIPSENIRTIDVTNEIPREVGFGGGVYETEQVLQLPSPKWDTSLLPVQVEGNIKTYKVSRSYRTEPRVKDLTDFEPKELVLDRSVEARDYPREPLQEPLYDPSLYDAALPVQVEGTAKTYTAPRSYRTLAKVIDATNVEPKELVLDRSVEARDYGVETPKTSFTTIEPKKLFVASNRMNKPFKPSIPKSEPVGEVEIEIGGQILIQKMEMKPEVKEFDVRNIVAEQEVITEKIPKYDVSLLEPQEAGVMKVEPPKQKTKPSQMYVVPPVIITSQPIEQIEKQEHIWRQNYVVPPIPVQRMEQVTKEKLKRETRQEEIVMPTFAEININTEDIMVGQKTKQKEISIPLFYPLQVPVQDVAQDVIQRTQLRRITETDLIKRPRRIRIPELPDEFVPKKKTRKGRKIAEVGLIHPIRLPESAVFGFGRMFKSPLVGNVEQKKTKRRRKK